MLKQCGQLTRLRVGEVQLISCSRFPPVAQATLWVGVYKDHGTSLGGFNGQVAGECGFTDTTFLCSKYVYIHLRKYDLI